MPTNLVLIAAVIVMSVGIGGFAGYKLAPRDKSEMRVATIDEPVVMHTNGGLLEVATIKATERFDNTTTHSLFGQEVGNTFAHIRVPVTYRYHIALAPEWRFMLREKTFVVVAPPVKPSLPVAIDTAKLERESHGIWSLITGTDTVDKLQRSITPTLAEYAASKKYLDLQRDTARTTVTEFVGKWVMSQEKWSSAKDYRVKVFFADESIQSLQDGGYAPVPVSAQNLRPPGG